jgi:hypothetical protein
MRFPNWWSLTNKLALQLLLNPGNVSTNSSFFNTLYCLANLNRRIRDEEPF